MSENEIVFNVLQETGLNWSMSKQPVMIEGGAIVPDAYAAVRSDTEKPIAIVGDKYRFMQNADMAHVVMTAGGHLFDADFNFKHPWNNAHTLGSYGNIGGGSLRDGKAVFIQMELPEAHVGRSGIRRYVTITNRHDGNGSLGFGTANQVICCANTFAKANMEVSKFRHTASMAERVDEAAKIIRRILDEEERQMSVFQEAAKTSVEKWHFAEITKAIFGVESTKPLEELSTRSKNNISAFTQDIQTSFEEQGETVWALFNAVTRYTNHTRVTKGGDKEYSLLFGTDAEMNNKAYATMLRWLNLEQAALV